MKSSIFNILQQQDNDFYVYNTLTSSIAKLRKEDFEVLERSSYIVEPSLSNSSAYGKLVDNKFIIDDETDELKQLEECFLVSKNDTSVLTITVAPTLKCNFKCHYCYEARDEGRMTDENIIKLLSFIENRFRYTDVKKLNFSWFGGEPLLCIDTIESATKDILELAGKYNVETRFWIITNGYLLDDRSFQVLQGIPNLEICITLDGTKEFHDSKRVLNNGGATFDVIVNNIHKLHSRNFVLTIRVNIDKDNIDGAFNIIKELRASNIDIDKIYAGHLQDHTEECYFLENKILTIEEFASVSSKFNNIAYDYKYRDCYVNSLKPIDTFCRAQKINTYVINYNFSIALCENDIGNFDKSIGDYSTSSVEEINNNTNFKKYHDLNCFSVAKCRICKLLPICKGGCPFLWIKHGEPQCPVVKYTFEDDLTYMIGKYAQDLALI